MSEYMETRIWRLEAEIEQLRLERDEAREAARELYCCVPHLEAIERWPWLEESE